MAVSYKKLSNMLIEKDMTTTQLQEKIAADAKYLSFPNAKLSK